MHLPLTGFSNTQNWQSYKTVKMKKPNHRKNSWMMKCTMSELQRCCYIHITPVSEKCCAGWFGTPVGWRWPAALTNHFTVSRIRWNKHICNTIVDSHFYIISFNSFSWFFYRANVLVPLARSLTHLLYNLF